MRPSRMGRAARGHRRADPKANHHARARALFALLLDRAKPLDGLTASNVACLLYVLVHTPNANRPSAAIMRRVLDGAARMARKDQNVRESIAQLRTNLACLRDGLAPSAARLPWEPV